MPALSRPWIVALSTVAILFTIASPRDALCEPPRGRGGFVRVNSLRLHYDEQGHGPPLILLHGGGLSSASWTAFAKAAARRFRVFRLDSRGHGQTSNPSGAISYDLMADDVAAFLRARHLHRPLILGYSDGGIVALTLARKHPELARALVVAGAAPVARDTRHYLAGLKRHFAVDRRGELRPADLDAVARERPAMVERYQALHPRADPAYWRTLLSDVWPMWSRPVGYTRAQLARVETPTLVLLGDRDEFFRPEDGRRLARMLPRGELALVSGAGHAFFRDAPERFRRIAERFLAAHAAAR